MPHASPDMSQSGGLHSPPGTHLALWYARNLGIPAVMVNKVGRSYKPPPNEINGFFPGQSAIVDSDGTVRQSMDDKEGVAIADVTLDPGRKTRASEVCTGIGIAALTVGGSAGAADVAFIADQVPNIIDGIGLMGHDDHSPQETADLATLPSQTKRAAILLYRLSGEGR